MSRLNQGQEKIGTGKQQGYHSEVSTSATPAEAFDKISRVQEWWSKNFEGASKKVDDVFTVRFLSGDRYKIRVAESSPNQRIVWDVIDAFQSWVKNSSEWKGTRIIWEIGGDRNAGVSIAMTHAGLVPGFECFSRCEKGWDYLVHDSLSKLLSEGKGLPV